MLKPGYLTTLYVKGKRVSYIHPIRLYIFISIVFFLAVLSGNHDTKVKEPNNEAKKEDTKVVPENLSKTQKDSLVAERMKDVEGALKYIPFDSSGKAQAMKAAETSIRNDGKTEALNIENTRKLTGNWVPQDTTVEAYEKRQAALPKDKRDGFLKHYYAKRAIELNKYPDPQQKFIEGLLHNIPKMMFLLLPLFALMLKMVYSKKYYYEHLIYAFHLHSAIFLAILTTMLLQWFFNLFYSISGWLSFFCFTYVFWYIYRSLRTFYNSKRWATVMKMIFLFLCYSFILALCFLITTAISFAII